MHRTVNEANHVGDEATEKLHRRSIILESIVVEQRVVEILDLVLGKSFAEPGEHRVRGLAGGAPIPSEDVLHHPKRRPTVTEPKEEE